MALEQKTSTGLNTLLEMVSSWAAVMDEPSRADVSMDVVTLQQLSELKCAWERTRDSMHDALAALTSEPAQQVHRHRSLLAFMRPRSTLR